MFSLMSNNTIRRGAGVLAVFAIVSICIFLVPNADAATRSDLGPDRVRRVGDSVANVPGDNDGVTGNKFNIRAEQNDNGECGGGGTILDISGGDGVPTIEPVVKCSWLKILLRRLVVPVGNILYKD